MNDMVKAFLDDMRQLPGFPEFLNEMETRKPTYPRFKKDTSVEEFGAATLFASGKQEQHSQLMDFLTGSYSQP